MPCERGTLVRARDGLSARCVGPWSRDKLYYVRGYLELFARAMQRKFAVRHYVDLFAGPGRCVFDDDSGEVDGSPLLALKIEPQFTRFHFVDADPAALAALLTRLAQAGGEPPLVQTYEGDANAVVRGLSRAIPADRALSVAVIDPTGLDLTFEALRTLTRGQRMDLIYVFPEGMAAKRNLERFLRRPQSRLDRALGTDAWRGVVRGRMLDPADAEAQWEQVGRPLVDILREQLLPGHSSRLRDHRGSQPTQRPALLPGFRVQGPDQVGARSPRLLNLNDIRAPPALVNHHFHVGCFRTLRGPVEP